MDFPKLTFPLTVDFGGAGYWIGRTGRTSMLGWSLRQDGEIRFFCCWRACGTLTNGPDLLSGCGRN